MVNVLLQAFTMDVSPATMLGYAADVTADLIPLALASLGVFMGIRVYRAVKR